MANKLYQEGLQQAKQEELQEAIATWERVLQYTAIAELHGETLYNMGPSL